MIIEVCVESVAGALAASRGGADRVELCADLYRGGTTPGPSAIRLACTEVGAEVVVLIRPRPGDFEYTALELGEMCDDVRYALDAGASGVAIGALTSAGRVDQAALELYLEAAEGAPLTFHRAFDWCTAISEDLEVLAAAGVRRILTSGGAPTAEEGADQLRALVKLAGGRIEVVAAGGIRVHNAAHLVQATGVRQLHFSAFAPTELETPWPSSRVSLSARQLPPESERRETSPEIVRALRREVEADR